MLVLDEAYNNMPVKIKELLKDFWDPSGLYRIEVLLNFDSTYRDTLYTGLKMLQDIIKQNPCGMDQEPLTLPRF